MVRPDWPVPPSHCCSGQFHMVRERHSAAIGVEFIWAVVEPKFAATILELDRMTGVPFDSGFLRKSGQG